MPKQTDSQSNSSASSPVHNQNTSTEVHTASDGRVATFIRKVYNILEEQLFPDIVDWSQDGLAIVIKKPTEFSQKVLPKYFKHNHISSFIRQLNMYSFQKKRSRHAGHIYAHDLFQRGAKHLLCQIKRKVKDFANTSTGSGQEIPPTVNSNGSGNNNNTPSSVANPTGTPDVNTLISENQLLKNLQEQAISKMQALEQRVKELTAMNQNLHAQLQGKAVMENNNMKPEPKVQHIYNLNKAMLVGMKNPFVMNGNPNGNVKQEDEIQSLSPVKGLSLRINKPMGQNEPQSFMLGASNTFTIGQNFANPNPNIKPVMSVEDVSPSTRPSPPNTDNIPVNPELGQWGHQLMQQQTLHQNLQNVQQNFQNLQNLHQQRLSIGQAHGFFSNLSENKDPVTIPVIGNSLGKREFELEDMKQIEEPLRKIMQKGWNDHAATLNLSDIRKFHSNLFSSIGDKEFDPKHDNEVDLLCFE